MKILWKIANASLLNMIGKIHDPMVFCIAWRLMRPSPTKAK